MSTNVIKQTILGEPGRQTIKMVVRSNERGPKGEKGDPGVQGPQGIPGPRGYDGVIQYRAGTGINISDNNVITATGDATAAWGGIQGNIANQADLQNALNAKQDTMADFVGANGIVAGESGKVPAPAATDNVKVLGGNGNWNALGKLKFSDSGTVVATYDPFTGGEQTVNITTSVGIGSVLSEPTDVAYVDTVNIVDGAVTTDKLGSEAVTADKIDLSTLSGNYSTSEVDTGFTWVDGKTIYKKTVSCGTLPNNSTTTTPHGISNLELVVKFEGFAYDGTNIAPLPLVATNGAYNVQVSVNATNISLTDGADRSSYTTSYITLYYTKTS